MKILFFGDSITDAGRKYNEENSTSSLGYGFVRIIADRLTGYNPEKFEVLNRGISGNRIVDLYARVKRDFWNLKPDVVSILIGVNDVWHELDQNGVELERFENVYRTLISDTLKALPNIKIVLCEPFILMGTATASTEEDPNRFRKFCEVYKYAETVKRLAQEFNLPFLPLQEQFAEKAKQSKAEYYLRDGVHPNIAGATLIADEWLKLFESHIQ